VKRLVRFAKEKREGKGEKDVTIFFFPVVGKKEKGKNRAGIRHEKKKKDCVIQRCDPGKGGKRRGGERDWKGERKSAGVKE